MAVLDLQSRGQDERANGARTGRAFVGFSSGMPALRRAGQDNARPTVLKAKGSVSRPDSNVMLWAWHDTQRCRGGGLVR